MKPLILTRDKHIITILNQELNKTLRYDLKLMSMQKQNKNGDWICVQHQYPFFDRYSISDIECKEEKFKNMILKTVKLNPLCRSVSTFISRLNNALVYENYIAQGIETQCSAYIGGNGHRCRYILTKPFEFYSKHTIDFIKKHNLTITCDMENCFLEDKELMERLIDSLGYCDVTEEQKKKFFTEVAYHGGTFQEFMELTGQHRYDIKSLINYLFNYLLPFENIKPHDGISELRDYYAMANTIGREVKKYPKYLRSMHDIITANYNSYKREYDEALFSKLKKPELEFQDKAFCVVIPDNSKEIINEGANNNHCVASYVDRILRQETYIFFLRKTEFRDSSLITLELKKGTIINAKGAYNRKVSQEEKQFLQKYCKIKDIKLAV